MRKTMYYKRDWTPYPGSDHEATLAWAKDFEDCDIKSVANTKLRDGKIVSTVWLGLDHNVIENGPIQIFETMVFPSIGNFDELDVRRYSTEEEAKKGHEEMVNKWEAQ